MMLTPDNRVEGDPITFLITNPDGTRFQIDNFFLRPETYAAAFADTRFRAFAWGDLWVSDTGQQRFPDGYWDAMLADPLIVNMRAEKIVGREVKFETSPEPTIRNEFDSKAFDQCPGSMI